MITNFGTNKYITSTTEPAQLKLSMKIIYLLSIAFFFTSLPASPAQSQNTPIYKDSSASVDDRVSDLIDRMTPEEKIGQLSTPLGWDMYTKNDAGVSESEAFRDAIQNQHIGMLWATLRADPWTQKTLETGLNPRLAAEATNALQTFAIEQSRLGIPVMLSEECPHGHMAIGATVFPTSIGQSSTWNPGLIGQMAEVIGKEARLQGGHNCYGPVLDLAREPRWSRLEETYGEDPVLISKMGEAMVKGLQGESLNSGVNVISTLKHFAAYGIPEGGHNGSAVHVGNRELHSRFLPPFKSAVDAGALSVMTAYNSIDGIPNTSNRYLLTDVLRDNWGFNGFVVSDLHSIEGLVGSHSVAENQQQAASLAIHAGVDADLGGNGFSRSLQNAIESGDVSEDILDRAVSRILRLKFEMGLFENPFVDPDKAEREVRKDEHIELAKQVARESITLLKNENNLLPLNNNLENITVIGPNAHNIYNQLGDYTAPQHPDNIVTVLDGIQNKLSPDTNIHYVQGTAIRDTVHIQIEDAVDAANQSEVAIVVLGGSSARDFETTFIETGAATVSGESDEDVVSDMESGEGFDRATLNLMGKQLDLLKAVVETGTPTVLVLIKGRPLLLNWPDENVPAILDAWYPGQEGGNAIADVLFGDYNPAGRLPVSVPKSEGQLPVYYNHLQPQHHDYVEMDANPLYSFGYGLSYTSFEYGDLNATVEENENDFLVRVHFTVKNSGSRDGDEVAQLYIRNRFSSVVTPVKQLRAFERIHLKAGEEKTLSFELKPEDVKIWNQQMQWVAEAGDFHVMIGASSDDIRLETEFRINKDYLIHQN